MKPMIAFYSQTIALGGSEVYLRTILENIDYKRYVVLFFCNSCHPLLVDSRIKPLIDKGYIRIVFTRKDNFLVEFRSGDSTSEILHSLKAQLLALIPHSLRLLLGTIKDVRRLSCLFREHPVDILHFNDTGCEPATIAARLAGVPRILGTYHVMPDDKEAACTWVHRLIEWLSVRCMHYGIAVSQATKMAWMERVGISEQQIMVIFNGIDFLTFRQSFDEASVRCELGIPDGKTVICVPARLHPMKGHRYLLEAVNIIKHDMTQVVFLLLGSGELRAELESAVDLFGLNEMVWFLGHRFDAPRVMAISDFVVLPSVALEALPFALIEAQASGKAVVATNFSGIPEIVEDGVTGILVLPRDSKALAKAIMTFIKDPVLRQTMGEAGKQRAEQLFPLDRMLKETFKVYEECINTIK
jgi:glycosyltransferase involved in cell wall biosynthesis